MAEKTTKVPEEDIKNEAESPGDDEKSDKKEESIYSEQMTNRVIVARSHPLSYYVDRARRILRTDTKLVVSGRGNTMSMACTLVEVLKRQQIAQIESISTGMNVEPFFSNSGDPRWSQPTSMITFNLSRGELGEFVSDYHQRKVIEIFELTDKENIGVLTLDQIDKLNMAQAFKANDEQCANAKAFLNKLPKKSLDLPTFIKYASLLIHPLLKDKIFKAVLTSDFGIAASDNTPRDATQTIS